MRMPPLPAATLLAPEKAATRVLIDRPADRPYSAITISPYDPAWPEAYAREEARIRDALGPRALAIEHVGSTAVPRLAAKDRIDIDLIVADPTDEDAYVPALARVGYTLRSRDPDWYEHRCLWTEGHTVNLHIFGPDCDEYLRHVILRDWLRTHPDDCKRYEAAKFASAEENPWSMAAYVSGKAEIVVEILRRAGLR